MTSVAWFRRDLRLADNPMLAAAVAAGNVAPLFVFDQTLLEGRWASPNRNWFLLGCLVELRQSLRAIGSELYIRYGDPSVEVPRFAEDCCANDVYFARDYTPFARRRDSQVAEELAAKGISLHARRGTLFHEPDEVTPAGDKPVSVYTPFRKRWEPLPEREPIAPPQSLGQLADLPPGELPMDDQRFVPTATDAVAPGERAALERLAAWCDGPLEHYAELRDVLPGQTTSRLSQDLRWGLLSPLQVVMAARSSVADPTKFISEIAWREFYYYVLWFNPRVTREPFQEKYAAMRWASDPAGFEAWCEGQTGNPVVDAAMRQLLATGYMHNRARMIVASFLTKHLLLDWRLGERHFMRHLIDGDVANNNGGWQWAASTGTDPQPYFRIFNPILQGKRYDPEGAYVRQWVPELANVPARYIHEPWEMPTELQAECHVRIGSDYPAPIVEHTEARERALATYSAVGKEGNAANSKG